MSAGLIEQINEGKLPLIACKNSNQQKGKGAPCMKASEEGREATRSSLQMSAGTRKKTEEGKKKAL